MNFGETIFLLMSYGHRWKILLGQISFELLFVVVIVVVVLQHLFLFL